MAKKFNSFEEEIKMIEREEKEFRKKKKRLLINCYHQNKKGNPKLFPRDTVHGTIVECEICHTQFSPDVISSQKISDAIEIIHNVIHQIKVFSNPEVDKDAKLCSVLGDMDFNLLELEELYRRILNSNSKKKQKKREDDYGSFGVGNLSFIGGDKKKKKKNRDDDDDYGYSKPKKYKY